ncbi:glycosyltransferase involved in cell wall biosynthesis [Dyadobacter jejuensis]|uniref:Glycosyltransferase involved in cell wall biosynthesis n=1 Tax=Dyadobacter jejuensis TaxID=1082580 RepID=A0A316AUL1_9BACT|nr:glycosyltransferase family 4 protein [Dyadobacter jejuensis]PWJ60380.1 glycosyltransferase involved in cell wall biosynthesis [Dyadobacter jejuensis]
MRKKLVVVQQYLSWKGHYRQYFENLMDWDHYSLYASNDKETYPRSTWIPSSFDADKPLTIWTKIKGRFWDSFRVYKFLGKQDFDVIHFIEFEPLSFLLCSAALLRDKTLVITIHSSDRLHFSSWLNNQLSSFQRWLLETALKKAVKHDAFIVTHYQCHRQRICEIVGPGYEKQVAVIQYPTPLPETLVPRAERDISNPKFLIYGQIREDKGIFEFLSDPATESLNITIAGKVVDTRLHSLPKRRNLTVIDKFLSEEEINELVDSHDYMLLPYPEAYTNGAGTFKDSLAKAMPVVCSNIPIFKEIVDAYGVGIIFSKPSDILPALAIVDEERYGALSKRCLEYAQNFDWKYMRAEYFKIYDQLKESI